MVIIMIMVMIMIIITITIEKPSLILTTLTTAFLFA